MPGILGLYVMDLGLRCSTRGMPILSIPQGNQSESLLRNTVSRRSSLSLGGTIVWPIRFKNWQTPICATPNGWHPEIYLSIDLGLFLVTLLSNIVRASCSLGLLPDTKLGICHPHCAIL